MRPMRVVIADGGLSSRADLLTLAERAGFDVVGEALDWENVVEICSSRVADLVLVAGPPEFARGIGTLAARVASIVIAPDASASKEYGDSGAFAVLTPQTEPEVMGATAVAAVSRAADLTEARRDVEDLRQALETRKLVERAKGVLMRRLGISEQASYRKMQKASQDENRKMHDIAESILSAERLYGPDAEAPPAEPL